MTEALIELRGVSRRFERRLDAAGRLARALGADLRDEVVHAVDRVDLTLARGEVLGLAGESGCGKSTLGRIAAGLLAPSEGSVRIDAPDAKTARLAVQMIFQDPLASLNPRQRIARQIGEAPRVHGLVAREAIGAHVDRLLGQVGLDPADRERYPHQFSGGQRQRIAIARALAVGPRALVCDEAVAALDVSIQAQVLNLFMRLRTELGLAYLFISHDIGVIRHIADRVAVMYLGRIVETAPAARLFASPNHPYTRALLEQVPDIARRHERYAPIQGEIPSPLDPPSGCHFHPRCPFAMPRCRVEAPTLAEIAPGHRSACHLNDNPVA